jgi:peptide deformylase
MEILTIQNKGHEKFLRKKTAPFDFSKYNKKEIDELIKQMRSDMKRAEGVGLAGNQVGLNASVFVAQVENKFYAIFNPELTEASKEIITIDEGCLSVPGKYGPTPRSERVVLKGFDKHNRPIKIKAWGLLARVFQHEVGHLNGKLFIDHADTVYEVKK